MRVKTHDRTAIERLERLFKALADSTRLRILALLQANEVCVCHIHDSLGLPQPTVSRHLAYLRRSGLVAARRDGVWMHYRISPSLDPRERHIVDTVLASLAEAPPTSGDRKRFERSFGQLYVLNTAEGGACCAPRG